MKTPDTDKYFGDKTRNYFTAYVERALKNNRVSYYRKKKANLNHELLYDSEERLSLHTVFHADSSDLSDDAGAKQSLHPDTVSHAGLAEELRGLSDKDLSIIRMRIVDGCAYKLIGSLLGMSEEAARVRYFRAIQKMRDNMKGRYRDRGTCQEYCPQQ